MACLRGLVDILRNNNNNKRKTTPGPEQRSKVICVLNLNIKLRLYLLSKETGVPSRETLLQPVSWMSRGHGHWSGADSGSVWAQPLSPPVHCHSPPSALRVELKDMFRGKTVAAEWWWDERGPQLQRQFSGIPSCCVLGTIDIYDFRTSYTGQRY